ncbi:hypothetical protein [Microcoleus sp. herbarium12]|uniref:hypothetical protein n=1 Tax=Microcoleus sp. herbarium12 TaxID=3055437 RepID=UPI003FA53FA5
MGDNCSSSELDIILFYGITHLMEIWTLWHFNYWFSGWVHLNASEYIRRGEA